MTAAPLRKKQLATPTLELIKGSQPDKIRAELNIERWPAIWQPARSKNKPASRILTREVELQDGARATSRLEIGFTQLGTVTTEDQRMFYALVKHWEDSGKPTDPVYFSDRLLQRLLRKKWGTNVIDAITSSLRRLRTTPFTWTNSYRKGEADKAAFEDETYFTLIGDLKIIRRKIDGHITNQQGYFQFDKNILANLLANYTKPLFLDALFTFESEVAQLIYVHVDLMLASKSSYERRTKELFDDLGLKSESYRFASNRNQILGKAIKELQGVRLSTGLLKSVTIEKTKDEKDYKVVFRKIACPEPEPDAILPGQEQAPTAADPGPINNSHPPGKDPAEVQAEELIRYFHRIFHNVIHHDPQLKETSQAISLTTQYGLEKAKYIVEFAKRAATGTHYQPQTFGGILQYTSRALADFEAHIREVEVARQRQESQQQEIKARSQELARGESRLAALTPEEYQARFEQARNELYRRHPFMANQREGSKLHEGAIHRLMLIQIQE